MLYSMVGVCTRESKVTTVYSQKYGKYDTEKRSGLLERIAEEAPVESGLGRDRNSGYDFPL